MTSEIFTQTTLYADTWTALLINFTFFSSALFTETPPPPPYQYAMKIDGEFNT